MYFVRHSKLISSSSRTYINLTILANMSSSFTNTSHWNTILNPIPTQTTPVTTTVTPIPTLAPKQKRTPLPTSRPISLPPKPANVKRVYVKAQGPFICTECSRICQSKQGLSQHEKIHLPLTDDDILAIGGTELLEEIRRGRRELKTKRG